MDRVRRGGPWIRSTGVGRGSGPQAGWSMDPGSMSCVRPNLKYTPHCTRNMLGLIFTKNYLVQVNI